MSAILGLLGQVLGDITGAVDALLGSSLSSTPATSLDISAVTGDMQAAVGKADGIANQLTASSLGAISALSGNAYGTASGTLTSAIGKTDGALVSALGGSFGTLSLAYALGGSSVAAASLAAMNLGKVSQYMIDTLGTAGLSAGQGIAQLALNLPQAVVQMTGGSAGQA